MRKVETPINPQLFCDGLATFWQITNTAEKGDAPKYATMELVHLPYADKQIGDVRYYAALQADSKMSKVIRVPRVGGIQPSGDLVTLAGDDRQYKVQKISINTFTVPESMDVTLENSKQTYTLSSEEG